MSFIAWLRDQFKDGRANDARAHAERVAAVLDESEAARQQARRAIRQWECEALNRETALNDLWGRPPWTNRRSAPR